LEQVLPCLCVRPDISAFWINGREPIDFALVLPHPVLVCPVNPVMKTLIPLATPRLPLAPGARLCHVPPPPKCHNVPQPRCRYVPHQSPHLPVSFRRFGDPGAPLGPSTRARHPCCLHPTWTQKLPLLASPRRKLEPGLQPVPL
ncbi:hypothetical protein JTE90_025097, partial [Oedothorax gibbosus]